MAKILIVYSSKNGQTLKIAHFLGDLMTEFNHRTTVCDIASRPDAQVLSSELDQADAVIVGAPIYAGTFARSIRHWAKKNHTALSSKPSAFFSVCLGILQTKDEAVIQTVNKIVQEFKTGSDWRPDTSVIFAGKLAYTQYNWWQRWIMKRISKKAGGSTDTSRDFEYTDWMQVREFALDFARSLQTSAGLTVHALDAKTVGQFRSQSAP